MFSQSCGPRVSLRVLILLVSLQSPLFGQEAGGALVILPQDLAVEQLLDEGFHLYIRKKPGLGSVLLTESTRDPKGVENNYAYRTRYQNSINGDERRILNDEVIPQEEGVWSIIDSSPEIHPVLGEAFHLFIPWILYFGYPDTRHGEVYVVDGTFLNLRTFALPYGDYRGAWMDNPFILKIAQRPQPGPPEANYMDAAVETFTQIAEAGHNDPLYSSGPADLVDRVAQILDEEEGPDLDLVICLDTTASMADDIAELRQALIPLLERAMSRIESFRIGLLLYKDYNEDYLVRPLAFTSDMAVFRRSLDRIQVNGGRDIPEAVYEALYEGATRYPWAAPRRLMILIGDAPPHPRQRGRISEAMVIEAIAERNITVRTILLPQ
jgi:hypothetical protein